MTIYKYLIINRIREYIRLVKNMYIQVFGLLFFIAIFTYGVIKWYFPLLLSYNGVNTKVFYSCFGILIFLGIYECFGEIKPKIIIKPMTLFLLDSTRIKKILILKYFYYALKDIVCSFVLSILTCGLNFDRTFAEIFLLYFACLLIKLFAIWNIYNEKLNRKKNFFRSVLFISYILCVLSIDYKSLIWTVYVLLGYLTVYTSKNLIIDYFKYNNDMIYMEKILFAQNNNNTILLSQYAKEKIAMNSLSSNKNLDLLKKAPLIWKAFISISRNGKNGIFFGGFLFILMFLFYNFEFFWQFPILEYEQTRYILLVAGVFFLYQISVQTFVQQLNDIIEKQINGLFIPIELKKIILQFIIIPLIILSVVTFLLFFLLHSQILYTLVFYIILSVYMFITFFMNVFNRKLLQKLYMIFSILMFLISNLLLI
ncbi:MAG: hypothetical protein HFG28_11555 [Eubacterium sp.]|nr:hypothetical protein [Eubacterium sp.]